MLKFQFKTRNLLKVAHKDKLYHCQSQYFSTTCPNMNNVLVKDSKILVMQLISLCFSTIETFYSNKLVFIKLHFQFLTAMPPARANTYIILKSSMLFAKCLLHFHLIAFTVPQSRDYRVQCLLMYLLLPLRALGRFRLAMSICFLALLG